MKLFVYTFDFGFAETKRTHNLVFANSRKEADILVKLDLAWGPQCVEEFPIQEGLAGEVT